MDARPHTLDPRLLRHARAARTFVGLSVVLGTVAGLLLVAQAWLLATIVARAFAGGRDAAELRAPLIALLAVVLARAAVAWAAQLSAGSASARVKSQLRGALLARLARDRPERGTGEAATLATRGLDALDAYFALYLPQIVLAAVVPVIVLAAIASRDWVSAALIAVTLPLIPLFMALVGASTRDWTDRQIRALQRLAGHFLDVVGGLGTLKVFGRAKPQADVVGEVTDRYRRALMRTLRLSFLSALVLELLATLSVALVAVAVGVRLLGGHLDLRTALFVLVLAPEAYLPLRQLGAGYHAGAEGAGAAAQVFAVLERPSAPVGTRTDVPDPASVALVVEDLRVVRPGRPEPALDGVSVTIAPGEILAVTGSSGCGKSTLLRVLLGLVAPAGGSVRIGDVELAELDPDAWRARLAWVPQRPHLFAGSIGDNVRLGRPGASSAELRAAVEAAGLAAVVGRLPGGLDARLGDGGAGLSAGERQRIALARAFLRDAPLLLLDEPTASLDGATERQVLAAVRRLAHGRTVVLAAHRPALVELADRELALGAVGVAA